MRKIRFIFLIVLMFIGINKISAVELDTTRHVYDYAQVLTEEEESSLKEEADHFISTYNMDMVLVTVKYHTKSTTKAYAEDFYDYNNFGLGTNKDGILFVIDFTFGYKDIYILTTGEAIRVYDDIRINNMLDNIADTIYDSYYSAFNSFISDSKTYASLGVADSNKDTYIGEDGELLSSKKFTFSDLLVPIIISLVISIIVILILINKNKMVKKAISANVYLKKNSLVISNRNDRFITTHTTSVRINESSGSSSSSSGGSSISRGSSGTFHGGGGRRL